MTGDTVPTHGCSQSVGEVNINQIVVEINKYIN